VDSLLLIALFESFLQRFLHDIVIVKCLIDYFNYYFCGIEKDFSWIINLVIIIIIIIIMIKGHSEQYQNFELELFPSI